MWQLVMGFLMIAIVVVAFVLLIELIKVMLPALALAAVALTIGAVAVWISEPNVSARRERRARKMADKERDSHAKSAALQERINESKTSTQRKDSPQGLRAKDHEYTSTVESFVASIGPLADELPIDFFSRKLNLCLLQIETHSEVKEGADALDDGRPTTPDRITSKSAQSANNTEDHAEITRKKSNKRRQANCGNNTHDELATKTVQEARLGLLYTLEGIDEAERIRAVGTPLEDSYDKFEWTLNRKKTRMLLEDARNLIGASEHIGLTTTYENEALARRMQDLETLLWGSIAKSRRVE